MREAFHATEEIANSAGQQVASVFAISLAAPRADAWPRKRTRRSARRTFTGMPVAHPRTRLPRGSSSARQASRDCVTGQVVLRRCARNFLRGRANDVALPSLRMRVCRAFL